MFTLLYVINFSSLKDFKVIKIPKTKIFISHNAVD
jgi:hypothetical protein